MLDESRLHCVNRRVHSSTCESRGAPPYTKKLKHKIEQYVAESKPRPRLKIEPGPRSAFSGIAIEGAKRPEIDSVDTERLSGFDFLSAASEFALADIIPAMTLVEITFELQSPLTAKQLSDLAEFANTYGLRRFRHDEAHNLITFEYDASRLRQSQVVHALAGANIAVKRIVPQSGALIIPA
jgi:hypothetical protein